MADSDRASDARTYASTIRWYLKHGYVMTANNYLESYYKHYGNTRGYRKLCSKVTIARYNAQIG